MRSLVAGALALMSGGCLKPTVTQCDNGAICPDGFSCTEQASLCGQSWLVDTCFGAGKGEFASCEYRADPKQAQSDDGTCHAGICAKCTEDFAGCPAGDWTAMHTPVADDLLGLWVASDIDADVVGSNGTLLHYDGYAWKKDDAFATAVGVAEVTGIWRGGDAGLVSTGNGDIFTKTPTGWTKAATTGKVLRSISAASPTDAVAVGLAGTIIEFNGTTATPVTPPIASYPYAAVWVAGDGQAFAVGTQGGIVRRMNGTWSVLRTPSGSEPALRAVWGRSPTDVWFVGDPGASLPTILHYDGTTVAAVPLASFTLGPVRLNSIWGTATQLWAAAEDSSIAYFDGSAWSPLMTDAGVPLRGAAKGEHDVFTAGGAGRVLRLTLP